MSFLDRIPRGFKIIGIAVLVPLAPLGLAVTASLIGDAAGCAVNEGGASECRIGGVDVGESLYALFTAGWLGILLLPFSALAVLAGIGITALDFFNRKRRKSSG
ncbi:MAG: hypothetical protein ACKVS5_09860 [Parvularculaceae bacterium]